MQTLISSRVLLAIMGSAAFGGGLIHLTQPSPSEGPAFVRVAGRVVTTDGFDAPPWEYLRVGEHFAPLNASTVISTSPSLLTVPPGKRFVVTSLVTTNGTARWAWVCIDGNQVWKAFMDSTPSDQQPSTTNLFQGWVQAPRGLVAQEGQQVALSVGNEPGNSATVALVGYFVNS